MGFPTTAADKPRRLSRAWVVIAAALWAVAATALTGAFLFQRNADRPVGEGTLFVEDATYTASMLSGAPGELDTEIRHLRNELMVEGIAVVDAEGRYVASTSPNLVGTDLTNGMLRFSLSSQRFGAVAASITSPISIDGVTEWQAGDVLYLAAYPLPNGRGVLLFYDLAELLERRAREAGIQVETLLLLGVAAVLGVAGALLLLGRQRAVRRFKSMEIEAQFLKRQKEELEEHNQLLDEARAQAERALALAEEKNRIRAEFVLMINHELRTPLTSVVTGAELLMSDTVADDDRRILLDDMVADGNRLQEMIAQMLAVARIENRGLDYKLREVSVAAVCRQIEAHHPRLSIDRLSQDDGDLDGISVLTDPDTLAQLVSSLTDNALTHGAANVKLSCSDRLPFEPTLEVGVHPQDAVYFLITDDGPGIDPEFLPRAFEKFEKDSRSAGTGLGLYIARLMADAIDGSLSVHTSPAGTTVAIAVPVSNRRVEAA